ncbi:CaiB/BaiF CoA transferase family protein [Actinophytocola sp.]|uniref:CaiB/BaiF CoA transferase family protein n=1 Tax=Actinophytocola sp. TaxID=1872138 RepID=UPI003D6A9CF5
MGPLSGLRIVELAGRGPGPFAGMMLSDMGAEVVRVDRPGGDRHIQAPNPRLELVVRGRKSVLVDLKHPAGADVVLRLTDRAHAIFEGFRPGVVERLGIGPDVCLARNPALVYGRATGWGQTGPLASSAGHDINYIALAGALEPIGRAGGPPVIPLNLVGDNAGGMLLAFGLVCAMLEARESGRGQVVDAAMVDAASLLMTQFHGRRRNGTWRDERGTNYLDSGAPFYDVYETSDGRWVSIGAIEPKFHGELFRRIGLDRTGLADPIAQADWPELRTRLTTLFRTRTRAEWTELLSESDSCFAPVLGLPEVASHPHHVARSSFVEVAGVPQPAPAPRFSRTPGAVSAPPPAPGDDSPRVLAEWGFTAEEITQLTESGAVPGRTPSGR